MYHRRQNRSRLYVMRLSVYLTLMIFLLISVSAFGAKSTTARYKFFHMKNITAKQAKAYIDQLGIADVSLHPRPNTLLVTAEPKGLGVIGAMLSVVDTAAAPYEIAILTDASKISELPSNKDIQYALQGVQIGSFADPPAGVDSTNMIIDVFGDSVILIAPADQVDTVMQKVDMLKSKDTLSARPLSTGITTKTPGDISTEPALIAQTDESYLQQLSTKPNADTDQVEAEDLLDNLLESLSQRAEINVDLLNQQMLMQGEPEVADTVPSESPESTDKTVPVEISKKVQIYEKKQDQKPGFAKRQYVPSESPIADQQLDLNLPDRLPIVELLSLMGQYLDIDYLYEPDQLKGKDEVTLRLRGPIKIKDLYPLVESVLKFKGLAMVRKGNLVMIMPAEAALSADPKLLGDTTGDLKYGDVMITRVFQLRHIDPTSAANLLKNMKLGIDIDSSISGAKTLIVTGYAHRMDRIEELLSLIDKPGDRKEFRYRQLQFTMAENLLTKIKTLAEQLGTVSVTVQAKAATPTKTPIRGARSRPITKTPPPTPHAQPASEAVHLEADERTNRILMIGLAEQLDTIDKIIDTLDVEQQDLRTTRLCEIHYVDATDVKAKLAELGIISSAGRSGSGTNTRTRTVRSGSTTGKTPPPSVTRSTATRAAEIGPEGLVGEPQVIIVESTNSLLINATAEQHLKIFNIIGYIDTETLETVVPYEVYPLENQEPEAMAEVLNQLIQETIKDKEGKIEQIIKKTDEVIVIVPDASTFSLIVYANKKNQEWIRKLIKALDKRRPQVLIDVSLVEINRDDLFEYDLNMIANARDKVTGNVGVSDGAFVDSSGDLEFSWLSGQAQGFYSSDKIQALLSAVASKSYGRVLAQPKVLVNDNEEGLISTSQTTYVEEKSSTIVAGSDSATESISYTPYDAKIELKITPNISEGNLLRLKISMIREDFALKENVPPDYDRSNIDTTVTVPDGSTIILGGLIKLNQTKAGSKVPIIGDLPLVGSLFRSVSNNDEAKKLYVFVKATILRPDETLGLGQLKQISDKNRAEFEEEEKLFQKLKSFPGLKPKPMDPLKVLEAE